VARPSPNVNLALVQGGAGDGRVEATMPEVRPGSGIAFRCRGPGNCWRIEAVPAFGTWNLVKVVRNHEEVVAHFGGAPTAGAEIAVEMKGPRLRLFVDGALRKSIRDPALRDVPGVGLWQTSGTGAGAARWSDFRSVPADVRTSATTEVSP
jgi:hypothetical protein